MVEFPKVFIIILNWNAAKETINCVNSFSQIQYPNYELIVIDNGSTDDSAAVIKERFPTINLIETGENLGYVGGNNVGIKYAIENKAEYVLIVNNDTELVNSHFLQEMVKIMEENPKIGILGPKILNQSGKIQDSILFTPTLLNSIRESLLFKFHRRNEKDYSFQQEVESISGVCWLIKRKVIEEVGLLDEDYFMYCEEQDYCYRAEKAGWKVMYHPVESIVHYKESEDKNTQRVYRQYIYTRKNMILFLRKHFSFIHAFILALLFLISNIFKLFFIKILFYKDKFYNLSLLLELFIKIKDGLFAIQKNYKAK